MLLPNQESRTPKALPQVQASQGFILKKIITLILSFDGNPHGLLRITNNCKCAFRYLREAILKILMMTIVN